MNRFKVPQRDDVPVAAQSGRVQIGADQSDARYLSCRATAARNRRAGSRHLRINLCDRPSSCALTRSRRSKPVTAVTRRSPPPLATSKGRRPLARSSCARGERESRPAPQSLPTLPSRNEPDRADRVSASDRDRDRNDPCVAPTFRSAPASRHRPHQVPAEPLANSLVEAVVTARGDLAPNAAPISDSATKPALRRSPRVVTTAATGRECSAT